MIVVMKAGASAEDVQRVVDRVSELGLTPHTSKGESRTIIGAIGQKTIQAGQQLERIDSEHGQRNTGDDRDVSRFARGNVLVALTNVRFGGVHMSEQPIYDWPHISFGQPFYPRPEP